MFLHIRLIVSWPVSPERCQIATWPDRQYALRLLSVYRRLSSVNMTYLNALKNTSSLNKTPGF